MSTMSELKFSQHPDNLSDLEPIDNSTAMELQFSPNSPGQRQGDTATWEMVWQIIDQHIDESPQHAMNLLHRLQHRLESLGDNVLSYAGKEPKSSMFKRTYKGKDWLEIDYRARTIKVAGNNVDIASNRQERTLSAVEFDILRLLTIYAGWTLRYEYILLETQPDKVSEDSLSKQYAQACLYNQIWRIRSAVEPDPARPIIIKTVRGVGLRLDCDDQA